jgi:hypothetical protein
VWWVFSRRTNFLIYYINKFTVHNLRIVSGFFSKHTHKSKDRVTRTPLKIGGELRCSGRVISSCSTSNTCRVNLVTNLVISHEWGKNREVFTKSGTYLWSFVTQIIHNGLPSHGGDLNTFKVITWNSWFSSFLVSSNSLSMKS